MLPYSPKFSPFAHNFHAILAQSLSSQNLVIKLSHILLDFNGLRVAFPFNGNLECLCWLLKTQQRTLVPHKTFNWPLNCKFTRLHQRFTAWSCIRPSKEGSGAEQWAWGFQLLGPLHRDGQMFLGPCRRFAFGIYCPPTRQHG